MFRDIWKLAVGVLCLMSSGFIFGVMTCLTQGGGC